MPEGLFNLRYTASVLFVVASNIRRILTLPKIRLINSGWSSCLWEYLKRNPGTGCLICQATEDIPLLVFLRDLPSLFGGKKWRPWEGFLSI